MSEALTKAGLQDMSGKGWSKYQPRKKSSNQLLAALLGLDKSMLGEGWMQVANRFMSIHSNEGKAIHT